MQSFLSVYCEHDDFIHDLAFDWYGNRLATCSSDQKIKVFDHINGKWSCTAEIRAHSGSVHKLSWAHPEFGQVLASCSSDRVVHIFEEQVDGRTGGRTWKKQGRLVDSRDSVQDVQFAPRHLGLRLATCSLDGRVRIYESQDVMNLSVWPLVEEFDASRGGAHCLSWNTSPFDPPQMVVAAEKEVKLWEYNGQARKWGVVATLEGHADQVHDVAWAPNLGRSYHLLATACKDGAVRIYKLLYNKSTSSHTPTLVAKLTEHRSEVWRVSWNVSGTILASTGDDGVSRLWKSDFKGQWHPILVAAATQGAQGAAAAASSSSASSSGAGQQMQLTAASAPQGQMTRLQSAPAQQAPGYFSSGQQQQQQQQGSAFQLSNTPSSQPKSGGGFFGASDETKFADHRSFN
jgi:nucleoporin SEH1